MESQRTQMNHKPFEDTMLRNIQLKLNQTTKPIEDFPPCLQDSGVFPASIYTRSRCNPCPFHPYIQIQVTCCGYLFSFHCSHRDHSQPFSNHAKIHSLSQLRPTNPYLTREELGISSFSYGLGPISHSKPHVVLDLPCKFCHSVH
ncbi:disintegrin and metalloproteinase domain-containing protein 19 [Platysternon megacephalum]|uniref:Disintegrin and metalloproteinase domain-containing protein 19 n=1 Tax=Platysternon megacephalum TaxID=55544 RepID=A0A4D9EQ31_9SAUR|nr:disintegrin and metalloproteinase domain-containing protein 19 [Platysternon megacephalum]